MILTIGTTIKDDNENHYILRECIGQGGFGLVYKAERQEDKRFFAVKTLLSNFESEDTLLAFKNEITMAEQVKGENIIQYVYVHKGDEFSDCPPYIIMEYAPDGTLRNFINKRKEQNKLLSCDEIVSLYKQLICGMKEINNIIVHRDIKPENILLNGNKLKISDFGLGKMVAESTRTNSFKGCGTYGYIAPEAWNNSKNTVQMDIYAMGIVFYEIATLQYPYKISNQDMLSYQDAHLYAGVKDLALLQEVTNPTIASIVLRMMEKPTQKRYSNWQEILSTLEKLKPTKQEFNAFVSFAIAQKNMIDVETQRKRDAEEHERKEKENLCKLVQTQFENAFVDTAQKVVDQYNSSLGSSDKASISVGANFTVDMVRRFPSNNQYNCNINFPTLGEIKIRCKPIFPKSFSREVRSFEYGDIPRSIMFTPKLKNRDIIAWAELINDAELGYNFALCKESELYGDWFILNNKNNFSILKNNERQEPFAFGVDEVLEALKGIEAIHLHSSDVVAFTEELYIQILSYLLGNKSSNPFPKR